MKPQNILIVFVFAAIGLCIFLFKDKIMDMLKPKNTANSDNKNTETNVNVVKEIAEKNNEDSPTIADLDKDKLLKRSSNNNEVKHLQTLINVILKAKGKTLLVADGIFGIKTENALNLLIKKKQTTISQFATIMVQTKGKGL